MKTLDDYGEAAASIRMALDNLRVKGVENCAIVVFCAQKCDEMKNIVATLSEEREDEHVDHS